MRPALTVNPRSDIAFVEFVHGLVDDGVTDPAALQSRLRERYPAALVRRRELAGEPFAMWYVYRDGQWTPAS